MGVFQFLVDSLKFAISISSFFHQDPTSVPDPPKWVSFAAPYGGYVELRPTDFFSPGNLILNFRAQRPSGLIAYLANEDRENVLAIQLVDGHVEAVFSREATVLTRLKSGEDNYDDGRLHTVSVSKLSKREVRLVVDETDEASAKFRIRKSVVVDSYFFVGGLPSSLNYNRDAVTDLQPFVGCISDVEVGLVSMNFAERIGDFNANYSQCSSSTHPPEYMTTTPPEYETTTPRSESPEVGECRLSLLGNSTVDPLDAGAVFFATNESRYEYESLGRDYVTADGMWFGLKTAAEFGALYYTSDSRQLDYTTLYLEDGFLVYKFSYGSGPVTIRSRDKVNDNQWHQVRTMRRGQNGNIFVDGINVGNGVLEGNARYLSVRTPLYVGGLPSDVKPWDIPPQSRASLVGCIKSFTVDPPRELLAEYEVPQCQGSREPGVFFGQYGGYLVLDNRFSLGVNVEIELEIKPRKTTGTIFAVQKPNTGFMTMEMRSGQLYLTIQNGGGGEFTAIFSPEFSLCDGEWHQVKAIMAANEAYIEVYGVQGQSVFGNQESTEGETISTVYLGGLPTELIGDGIPENESYTGCMRKLAINGVDQSLSLSRYIGDVDARSCPAN